MITVKKDFADHRIKAGYSLSELARKAGLSVQFLSGMERGGGLSPSAAHRLSAILGAEWDDLFEITEKQSKMKVQYGKGHGPKK